MNRLLYEKTGDAVYLSHLDLMRIFQRAFRRADILIWHSQGFSPRAYVSIALPLSVGVESRCEILDFEIEDGSADLAKLPELLNRTMPVGIRVLRAYESAVKVKHLTYLQSEVTLEYDGGIPDGAETALAALFAQDEILVEKRSKKGGMVDVDLRPLLRSLTIRKVSPQELTLDVGYLSPTFSGAVTEYVAYVPYETRSATLSGVAKDEKALKVTEATMQLSQEGDNVMTVTCTAEDGTTSKTYTVHVYRMPKYEGIIPTMEIVDPNTPPEPPTYSIPMTVTLPLVGEMATSTAAIIGAALLVVILLLVGFLLGRIGHNGGGYDDDGDSGDDDDRPPQPPRPDRNAAAQNRAPQQSRRPEPVKAAPAARPVQQSAPAQPVRKAAPAAPARPQQRKVSNDTLTSPFVEDLSGKMQQEIAQRQAAEARRQAAEAEAARQAAEAANPAAAANEKVGRMSLDELLNDIHNM